MRWREIMEDVVPESRNYDWSGCPLVVVDPGKLSGAPVIVGTRVPVQTVVDGYDDGMQPGEIAEQFRLSIDQVNTILEYREHLHARST